MKGFVRSLTLAAAALALAACGTFSGLGETDPQTQVAVACKSYGDVLSIITDHRDELSARQAVIVDETVNAVYPICSDLEGVEDYEGALVRVLEYTATLNRMEDEL